MAKKLKYNEVAVLRMQTLQKNGGLCPICKEQLLTTAIKQGILGTPFTGIVIYS